MSNSEALQNGSKAGAPTDRDRDPDALSDELSPREAVVIFRRLLAEAWAPRATTGHSQWHDRIFARLERDDLDSAAWAERFLEESEIVEFDRELTSLKNEVEEKAAALLVEKESAQGREERIRDLEQSLAELKEKQNVSQLLSRVSEAGQKRLLESEEFRNQFVSGVPHLAYVVSIDIRRSTELMLKAREPQLFAAFISDMADQFRNIVLANQGVFDKFTGDGILAVFPEFYSGDDAGYLAVKTAVECHRAFELCYRKNRATFISVLQNTGLGIGIDFGRVHMVHVGGDLTVVGIPVVYACRMAGGSAGRTFVNHPAFEQLVSKCSEICEFEETEIDIKHEGPTVAYAVRFADKKRLEAQQLP
jgi:class 3 adenylate cyclase